MAPTRSKKQTAAKPKKPTAAQPKKTTAAQPKNRANAAPGMQTTGVQSKKKGKETDAEQVGSAGPRSTLKAVGSNEYGRNRRNRAPSDNATLFEEIKTLRAANTKIVRDFKTYRTATNKQIADLKLLIENNFSTHGTRLNQLDKEVEELQAASGLFEGMSDDENHNDIDA